VTRFFSRARQDSGASIVLVALCMPAMLLFLSFVIDVANGYVHSKHLQMQADAAALAAAADYQRPCSPAHNTAMVSTAELYGGMTKTPEVDNTQIGGTPAANVKMNINKRTWPDQPDKVDPDITEGEPCEQAMIDVKMTERDLPLFVGVPTLDAFKFINAHARVQFMKAFSTAGAMPLAVPMPVFETAKAIFVDESKAADDPARVLKTLDLTKGATAGSVTYWQSALDDVTVDAANVGVRVVLSETTDTTCGEQGVFCYDANTTDGLAHVRGWASGDTTKVRARDVRLLQGTCPDDPYFTYVTAACNFGVSADRGEL
jgi:hypothetical protein